jgi:cytoskeleton protein RodZ
MTEGTQTSVGQMLREAREAQGIALEDVAVRLRLMHRQIEAMEADDFGTLGQPVFARGFVRNYARLLGLAPEALLARMEGAPEEQTVVSQAEPPPQHAWLSSPWLIMLLLGVLLLLAVPVALYLWLNSGTDDNTVSPAPVVQLPHAPMAAPASAMPAKAPPASPVAPGTPATPKAVTALSGQTAAPAEPKSAAVNSVLHLEFGDESWTEIKDASGRMLLRQLNPAGSSVDVRGQPPFDVLIGNAAQARMSYNGRPIDLNPFIDVTVARFTLEE